MIQSTLDILSDLIAFPTVSADSNREMIAYLAQRFDDCGAKVEVFSDGTGQKANLLRRSAPKLMAVLCCLVTVMWFRSRIKPGPMIPSR